MLKARLLKILNNYCQSRIPLPWYWVDADAVNIYKGKGAKVDPANH